MTKDEVAIGRTYLAKVSDKVVPVRIDAEHPNQGWFGTNQITNKQVRIKSAQRLRSEVRRDETDSPAAPEATPAPEPPAPALRTPSYAERLMFAGASDPAAARRVWANQNQCGNQECPMSKKKTTKAPKTSVTKATAKTGAANPAPTKADKKPKKMSALDAAAKVLGEEGDAMSTGEMIEAMAKKGYWTSPGGKTPAATLYSAILREINLKGKASRFAKTERGQFARTKAE